VARIARQASASFPSSSSAVLSCYLLLDHINSRAQCEISRHATARLPYGMSPQPLRGDLTKWTWNVRSSPDTYHQFPAKTTPGTFKVALDSAVSRIACAGSDHAIRIIDWYSGQVITDGFGHGEPATSLCFSHDNGQLVSVSGALMF
jgi:WD40 repeat protein